MLRNLNTMGETITVMNKDLFFAALRWGMSIQAKRQGNKR